MRKDAVGSELRSAALSIVSQNCCLRQNMQLCVIKHRIVYMLPNISDLFISDVVVIVTNWPC